MWNCQSENHLINSGIHKYSLMFKVNFNKHLLNVSDFIYSAVFDCLLFSWKVYRKQCP